MRKIDRRDWLAMTSAAGIGLATGITRGAQDVPASRPTLRFGVITDVHQDIMHDGQERISAFAQAMQQEDLDFVIQLGDFCIPASRNEKFRDTFNSAHDKAYHVLGNHDMDGGYDRAETVDYLQMPSRYYSFDLRGIHLVVLDGNDPGGQQPGYARYIGPEQLDWLRQDLRETKLPAIIFSHQPLNHDSGVENHTQVREVLAQANAGREAPAILGCFSGHFHLNHLEKRDGIHYAQLNSAAYLWVGSRFEHHSYAPEIHQEYANIRFTCPYANPLWGVVSVNLEDHHVQIAGRQTDWVGPTPEDLEIPPPQWPEPHVRSPRISSRQWHASS